MYNAINLRSDFEKEKQKPVTKDETKNKRDVSDLANYITPAKKKTTRTKTPISTKEKWILKAKNLYQRINASTRRKKNKDGAEVIGIYPVYFVGHSDAPTKRVHDNCLEVTENVDIYATVHDIIINSFKLKQAKTDADTKFSLHKLSSNIKHCQQNYSIFFLVDNVRNIQYYTSAQLRNLKMDADNNDTTAQIMSVMIVEKEVIAKKDTKASIIHYIVTKNTVQNKGYGKKLLMLTMDQPQIMSKRIFSVYK